jgi:hypothetical protein
MVVCYPFVVAAMLYCLLALAASAAAECAWVLWQHTIRVEPQPQSLGTTPISAYASKDECEQAGRHEVQAAVAHGHRSSSDGLGVRIADVIAEYRCLPDTIDPRGPKEKGQ